jgi:uncharacterized protein YggE
MRRPSVRNLADAGGILDKAVGLGVNQGGGIAFVKDDMKPTLTEARKRAVADAIARAKTLAEAAEVKLGKILSIEEQSSMPRPMPYGGALRMAASDASVPPGERREHLPDAGQRDLRDRAPKVQGVARPACSGRSFRRLSSAGW